MKHHHDGVTRDLLGDIRPGLYQSAAQFSAPRIDMRTTDRVESGPDRTRPAAARSPSNKRAEVATGALFDQHPVAHAGLRYLPDQLDRRRGDTSSGQPNNRMRCVSIAASSRASGAAGLQGAPRPRLHHRLVGAPGADLHHRLDERLPRAEMIVEASGLHSDLGGDVAQPRRRIAVAPEDPRRRVQDALPRRLRLADVAIGDFSATALARVLARRSAAWYCSSGRIGHAEFATNVMCFQRRYAPVPAIRS